MEILSIAAESDLEGLDALTLKSIILDLAKRHAEFGKENAELTRGIAWRDAKIAKITFENAQLRRMKFGRLSEKLNGDQKLLFEEAVEEDIAALEQELADLAPIQKPARQKPKREPLPANLPRVEFHHEPESKVCACGCPLKRIGEDVSEKLHLEPSVFSVERHIRGKWACKQCEILIQAPMAPDVIDKGIPTAGLLAQVLIAKYADHLPLYRQEGIFGRAGLAIPRATLCGWTGAAGAKLLPLVEALKCELLSRPVLHVDETPVSRLAPGMGKNHKSFLWAYATGEFDPFRAVVYDFADTRAGEHPRAFLGGWRGSLICDDYSGYKASFELGVTETGCMAHVRRNFFEIYDSDKSVLASTAMDYIRALYAVEAEAKSSSPQARLKLRQTHSVKIAADWHAWMIAQRMRTTPGTLITKAIDHALNRWTALTRFLDDPALPIDNNHIERQIRPWAQGRKSWLHVGTLLAGQRAAAISSLIHSAKLNGINPYAYLKDVLQRLPTQKHSELDQLLPHRWAPL